MPAPQVAVVPDPIPAITAAVGEGGGVVVPPAEAEAVIWTSPRDADGLAQLLAEHGGRVGWVQLPYAGIERFVPVLDHDRVWTCAKEIYGDHCAELALALMLAGLRSLHRYIGRTTWGELGERNLLGAHVVVLGGGGITRALVPMLAAFGCRVTVVRRSGRPFDGVDRVVTPDALHDVLPGADVVVVALSLTPETEGIIGAPELALMPEHCWVVNVARGRHIVTDDLVAALTTGAIGGAGLDVTEPEPLPDGHPLWTAPNCIITPHVANTWTMAVPALAAQTADNVERFGRGDTLTGLVDVDAGY
jgi:phosphoglycerate dehydrogenase-like enzyme